MDERSLTVGSVVFLIIPEKQVIVPARVTEELLKRKLDGNERSYTLKLSTGDDIVISDIDKVYTTIGAAREHMIEAATSAVDALCKRALLKSEQAFGPAPAIVPSGNMPLPDAEAAPDEAIVDVQLPDGTKARARVKR